MVVKVIVLDHFINPYYILIGCPKIVRADKGTENAKISFLQPFLRYQGTNGRDNLPENTFRYGRSVNNQASIYMQAVPVVTCCIINICRESSVFGEACISGSMGFG